MRSPQAIFIQCRFQLSSVASHSISLSVLENYFYLFVMVSIIS